MLDRIKASLPSLAPAEQRVGRLVLGDPRAFANLPVSELAERAHVSKPTVVRFCRSIGYDGLSDLMDACGIARKNGATAIVVTATGSPLPRRATFTWRPIIRKATTATARWSRGCCTW